MVKISVDANVNKERKEQTYLTRHMCEATFNRNTGKRFYILHFK